jgi:amino-acid N-acetyltransferase
VQTELRSARPGDQGAITAIVRQARLNPFRLNWSRFVVAERDREIVGVIQVREHRDGTLELASLVVHPACRGHGVSTRLIDTALAGVHAEVFTVLDDRYTARFRRWGFLPVEPGRLPRPVWWTYRIGRVVTAGAALLGGRRIRLVPLRRPRSPHPFHSG